MNDFFGFSPKDSIDPVASAYAPKGTKLSVDLIHDLQDVNELPFSLKLVKLSTGSNGLIKSDDLQGLNKVWLDYQPNSLAWPLFSEKLKDVIDKCLTQNEGVNWITAKVCSDREQKIYYIPRFEKMLDVLNFENTLFVSGTDLIIRPTFSFEKIKNYSLFSKPSSYKLWKITPALYVSEYLKKEIQKAKIVGVSFEKVRVI